jgi:thymidylate synthase ThyX
VTVSEPGPELTPEERELVAPYFSDVEGQVFALTNLPEVVKGALFARYSRSAAPLRRLFVDEFAGELAELDGEGLGEGGGGGEPGADRAEALYQKVFDQYGDDSVAQLGGAHVALEHVSNLLTKRIEWGRLAAYLEQSTRYIAYDDRVRRPDGSVGYRYHRDADVLAGPHADAYVTTMDAIFDTYASLVPDVLAWVRDRFPQDDATPAVAWRNATKAKALDLLRGLLPAATTSNVGMFASGQSYEGLLLRLRASGLAESRAVGDALLRELRQVIPAFLTRVDVEDRGVAWSRYLADTAAATRAVAAELVGDARAPEREPAPAADLVTLTGVWPADPVEAEVELATAALYSVTDLPEVELRSRVAALDAADRRRVVLAYVGERRNRRHKPGRGFERVQYRFTVLGDYGGFRDLQRHRMLTVEWQDLTTRHGYETPAELEEAGVADRWHEALARSAELYERLLPDHPEQAQYAVCFAYRVRYVMQLNARAAMQMLELRSTPQGHPQYRRVVQEMHRLIRDEAGHGLVADAMSFVDHGEAELERLESEKAIAARRAAREAQPEA